MISAVLSDVHHAGVEDQVLPLDAVQRALEDRLFGEVVGYDFAWAFGNRVLDFDSALPIERVTLEFDTPALVRVLAKIRPATGLPSPRLLV